MDLTERMYQSLVRWWQRARGRSEPGAGPHAARLEPLSGRLEVLAALLSGRAMDLKPADGLGGVSGDVMLLPKHIELTDDPDDNVRAYLYRVAYATVAHELGLDVARSGWDAHAERLAVSLADPAVRAALHEQYPATAELEARLLPAALAERSDSEPGTMAAAIEALLRRRLGAPPQTLADESLDAWVARAERAAPEDPDAWRDCVDALLADLRRAAPVGPGDPPPGVVLWGRPLPARREEGGEVLDVDPSAEPDAGERRVVELDRTIRLERRTFQHREDKPLYHVFEKIETADEYGGEGSTPDASGDVQQMEDALRELQLGAAVRTDEDPRNLVRADVIMEPTSLEVPGEDQAVDPQVFRYPEWDFKKGRYRPDWCTVTEERLVAGPAAAGNLAAAREILRTQRRHVDDIRLHLMRALYRRQIRNRQVDGPDIDVEAMVERHADLAAGHTPPERLYLSARKALREIAILVLLDTSFSTDAWIEGRRVLDIEMQSLLVLSEALEGHIEEEVAIASFHSHTRKDVRFGVLKGFDDSWKQLRRVATGLAPQGYTRIGAALRHGTAVLDAAKARHKLLLLVSDGKPTDFDKYEGRHGVEDVAQAVREANQRQIQIFGLAIEKEAKRTLARMLGPGAYRILPRTELLPDVMAEVFLGVLTR